MNTSELTYLLNKPESVNPDHIAGFDKILNEFPYFQSARILELKLLHKQDNFKYNTALKLAAAYTTDRSILFDFITTDAFLNKNKSFLADKNAQQPIEIDLTEEIASQVNSDAIEKITSENVIDTTINEMEINVNDFEVVQPNTLENSILASINSASQQQMKEEDVKEEVIIEVAKEKISWLEDIVEAEEEKIISFGKDETHSFQEWLQLANMKPIEREENNDANIIEEKTDNSNNEISPTSKMDLINKFIETNPKIPAPKDNVPAPSYTYKSDDTSYLMTETLAKIYLEQKKYSKAIQAYEILILKYPEKSSLFADRILDIKELQQNNNSKQ